MNMLFEDAINTLKNYGRTATLSGNQLHALAEAVRRLEAVSKLYPAVIDANKEMLRKDTGLAKIRQLLTEENVNLMMQEQAKRDPSLAAYLDSIEGRLYSAGVTEIKAFNMSSGATRKLSDVSELEQLHTTTENIYHNLWAVKLRLSQLPVFNKFSPVGVRDVRNKLIEHVDSRKGSGASIYSFGLTTNGPVLRPVRPAGISVIVDAGLVGNVQEFLEIIIRTATPVRLKASLVDEASSAREEYADGDNADDGDI